MTLSSSSYVAGIDLGTSGVRTLLMDTRGRVVAEGKAGLPAPSVTGQCREQAAGLWWTATRESILAAVAGLRVAGGDPRQLQAVCVDGTSGTVVPVDASLTPLCPGLMYNDGRAAAEANALNDRGQDSLARLGYRFNASFSLPKIKWLTDHRPDVMARCFRVLHQADFINANLIGTPAIPTDVSNALKTGFDSVNHAWPAWFSRAGIPTHLLPDVVAVGQPIGHLSGAMAAQLGLSPDTVVVGGMTDGTAAFVASGARAMGDGNTTLGTTIVWKLLAHTLITDPEGRLYSHKHPGAGYIPGGAGNAGGQGILDQLKVTPAEYDVLLAQVDPLLPTGVCTYPGHGTGERFPFVDATFEAFTTGAASLEQHYQSCLEGVACIERWGYEVAQSLGGALSDTVWTTGTGATIDKWMQLRANVLNRNIGRVSMPVSAYGSAVIAAMGAWFDGDWSAASQLVTTDRMFYPHARAVERFDAMYHSFREHTRLHREKEAV